jgi:hypothetical protein
VRISAWLPSVRFTSTQPAQFKESDRLYAHTRTASITFSDRRSFQTIR